MASRPATRVAPRVPSHDRPARSMHSPGRRASPFHGTKAVCPVAVTFADPPAPTPVQVLKFGSSVLRCPSDYPRVAVAIRSQLARGHKIVAVVSAMGNATDSLFSAALAVDPDPPDRLIGALLATGEEASVALLALALAAQGVSAQAFNPWQLPVRTRGTLSNAEPVSVDSERIHEALGRHDAVVLPGFVGVDRTGVPSLLGRGGSDLTALFLGDALNAGEIRLVKDVDGIYPTDPGRSDHGGPRSRRGDGPGTRPFPKRPLREPPFRARPFREVTCRELRVIGGGVVQPKALDFAERRGLRFRVTGLSGRGTTVGSPVRWKGAS